MRDAEQVRRQAGNVGRAVSVLRCLLDEETVLHNRSADLEPRRPPLNAVEIHRRPALGAERRIEIVEPHLPLVAGAPRLNDDEAGREAAVFDRVWIRHHFHGIDRIVGQRHRAEPGRRVDEAARSKLDAGLRGTAALDADAAGHFDDARQQAQRRRRGWPLFPGITAKSPMHISRAGIG